jgi:predicted phosphodiesterase
VIRDFVEFVSSFPPEKLIIVSGNHERFGDGRTALDFLKAIDKPWKVLTSGVSSVPVEVKRENESLVVNLRFIPYQTKLDWQVETDEEAAQKMVDEIGQCSIVFAHHAVKHDSVSHITTDFFNEPILDSNEMFKFTDMVVIGHIHEPKLIESNGKIFLRTGAVFTNKVDETHRSIWTIEIDNEGNKKVIEHELPVRGIYKVFNPTVESLEKISSHSIVKIVVTDRSIDSLALKNYASERFDGSLVVESYDTERNAVTIEGDVIDYSIEKMIHKYAEAKSMDASMLLRGYEMIRK